MINDLENQRDLAWFRCRIGCFTGSKIGDLMKSGRKKEQIFGDVATSYIYKVAAERMLNPVFVNDDELFGILSNNKFTRKQSFGVRSKRIMPKTF